MLRKSLLVLVAGLALGAASSASAEVLDPVGDMFHKPGFVGALVRPTVCTSNCNAGVIATFGIEGGYKFLGLAFRYGRKDQVNYFYPDLRFYWDFALGRYLTITPLIELSPMVSTGRGATTFQLVLRPGVRLGWSPSPYVRLFLEPFLFDMGFYTRTSVGGKDYSSSKFVSHYTFGAGIQARF